MAGAEWLRWSEAVLRVQVRLNLSRDEATDALRRAIRQDDLVGRRFGDSNPTSPTPKRVRLVFDRNRGRWVFRPPVDEIEAASLERWIAKLTGEAGKRPTPKRRMRPGAPPKIDEAAIFPELAHQCGERGGLPGPTQEPGWRTDADGARLLQALAGKGTAGTPIAWATAKRRWARFKQWLTRRGS